MSPNRKELDVNHGATTDISDTQELITRSREKMIKEMTPGKESSGFTDLDIAIKTVRALIVTNQEIWDRCKDHYSVASKMFSMLRFDEVKIQEMTRSTTSISVVAKKIQKSFNLDPLTELPESVGIFQPKKDETRHVDFNTYFSRSLVLHEDVLLPFLGELKEHLEKVQVCLGAVDEWVIGTAKNIKFLETMFDIKDIHVLPIAKSLCTCYYCERKKYGSCTNSETGKEYNLMSYRLPGKVVQSFDISNEKDKLQLKRLVEFLSNA